MWRNFLLCLLTLIIIVCVCALTVFPFINTEAQSQFSWISGYSGSSIGLLFLVLVVALFTMLRLARNA